MCFNNLSNLPVIFFALDKTLKIHWANTEFELELGYEKEDLAGKDFLAMLPPESSSSLRRILNTAGFEVKFSDIPIRVLDKYDETHSYSLSTAPSTGDHDRKLIQCVLKDATAVNELESRLIRNEQLLFQIQEIADLGTMKVNVETSKISFDTKALEVLGIDKALIHTSKDFLDKIHAEDRNQVIQGLNEIYLQIGRDHKSVEFRFSSEEKWKWISLFAGFGIREDRTAEIIATVQDISDRKNTEVATSQLKNRLQLATTTASIGILEWDLVNNRFEGNESLYMIFESTREDFDFLGTIEKEDQSHMRACFRNEYLANNSSFEAEFRINIGYKTKFLKANLEVIYDHNSVPKKIISAIIDQTDSEQQKLEMKEALAKNQHLFKMLHHRVQNNLQLLSSILFLNINKMVSEQDRDLMKEFNSRILRLSKMHSYLLDQDHLSSVDLNAFLYRVSSEFEGDNISILWHNASPDHPAIEILIEKAMIVGAILTELLYNACNHGVHKMNKNILQISFVASKADFTLILQQPKENIPSDLFSKNTLGISIIKSLASKLSISFEVDSSEIKFHLPLSRVHNSVVSGQAALSS